MTYKTISILFLCIFFNCVRIFAGNNEIIHLYRFENQSGNSLFNTLATQVSDELQENLLLQDIDVIVHDTIFNASLNINIHKDLTIYGYLREAINKKIYFEINCIDENGILILSNSLYTGINAGQQLKLIVMNLVKSTKKTSLCRVSVNSRIPGFLIHADHQYLGETPLQSLLKPGYYTFNAERAGYNSINTSFKLHKDTLLFFDPRPGFTNISPKKYPTKKMVIGSAISLTAFIITNILYSNSTNTLSDMDIERLENPEFVNSDKYKNTQATSRNYKYSRNISAGFLLSFLLGTSFSYYNNL